MKRKGEGSLSDLSDYTPTPWQSPKSCRAKATLTFIVSLICQRSSRQSKQQLFELLCLHVKSPQAGRIPVGWVWVSERRLPSLWFVPFTPRPPLSSLSLNSSERSCAACSRVGTYVQVAEVFIVVQRVADNEAVWDFESNICGSKHTRGCQALHHGRQRWHSFEVEG